MDYCTRAIEKNRKTVITKGRGIVKINKRGEKIEPCFLYSLPHPRYRIV